MTDKTVDPGQTGQAGDIERRHPWMGWLLVLIAGPAGIGLAGWLVEERIWAWMIIMGILASSASLAGWLITRPHLYRGLLIDDWNRISLSRLQAVIWTILILGAFLAAGIANVRDDESEPLSIAVPEELWAVMGISATSLVGTPLVKSIKQTRTADKKEAEKTLRQAGVLSEGQELSPTDGLTLMSPDGYVLAKGQNTLNPGPEDSSWSDLFEGEETSNKGKLDLGKLQMFYFTLIFVLAYGVSLGNKLNGPLPFHGFPELDSGLVALLGISHASYLTNKAVPRSKEAS